MVSVAILLLIGIIIAGLSVCADALLKAPIKPKRKKRKESRMDMFLRIAANRIAPYIKINMQKEQRLARALEVAGNKDGPKDFSAKVLLKSGLVLLLSIICFLMSPLIGFLGLALTVMVYAREYSTVYRQSAKIKAQLENEAAPFAAYIKEKLIGGERNIIKLLEEYSLTDNPLFAHELSVTVASMRTSSPENGLLQLGRRLSSEKLNMIIQGLLGVARGDNQQFYFQMISYDFDIMDKNALRKQVEALPKKLSLYMFLLMSVVIAELLTPMLIVITQSLRDFFK